MKRKIISPIVLASIFAVGAAPMLEAERRCSNATLNGSYGFYGTGTVLPSGTPSVLLGRESYDGNGHYSNSLWVNNNGILTHTNLAATYTVNPDCTGTVFLSPISLSFVIVDGGNEIDFIARSNPPAPAVYGVRKKQFPDNNRVCSNDTLNGTYGFYSAGTVVPAGTPRITLGRETYDGEGHSSSSFTVNDNGVETQHASSGLYVVNPDCTGTIVAPLGPLTLTIDFVIVDSAKEIYFIISSNPVALVVYGVRTKFSEDQ